MKTGKYVLTGENQDLEFSLTDSSYEPYIGCALRENLNEDWPKPANCAVEDGYAFKILHLEKENEGVVADLCLPVAKLIDATAGQRTFRFVNNLTSLNVQIREVLDAAGRYERTGKRQYVELTRGDMDPWTRTVPVDKLPAGSFSVDDFPGPEPDMKTDAVRGSERLKIVADIVKALFRKYEADIMYFTGDLTTRFREVSHQYTAYGWTTAFAEHGIECRRVETGDLAGCTMVVKHPGSERKLAVKILDVDEMEKHGFLDRNDCFCVDGIRIRKLMEGLDIAGFFKKLVDFYRLKSGMEVMLTVDTCVFDIMRNATEFYHEGHWKDFVGELRGRGLTAHTAYPEKTMTDRTMPFMVAEENFHLSEDGIRIVRLTRELLEADGFLDDDCFSCIDNNGFRQKILRS